MYTATGIELGIQNVNKQHTRIVFVSITLPNSMSNDVQQTKIQRFKAPAPIRPAFACGCVDIKQPVRKNNRNDFRIK